MSKLFAIAAGSLAISSTGPCVWASESDSLPKEKSPTAEVEEIVVTAQRREQNLQRTPIAITALTADKLAATGVESTAQLSTMVPGLQLVQVSNAVTPYLRGVGTQSATPGVEPSIAMYVDGVYYPAVNNNVFSLNNIERVEVLKGPQGTLFGRNATGGLIHIVTRAPSRETGGKASVSYGNFDTVTGAFYGTTAIGEAVAADLAVNLVDQGEGWGRNLSTGREINLYEEKSIRSRVRWDVAEHAHLTMTLDYGKVETDIGAISNALPGVILADGQGMLGSIYDSRSDTRTEPDAEQWGISLIGEYDFGSVTLLSISAYRDYTSTAHADLDRTATPIFSARLQMFMETLQQEFLLAGNYRKVDYTGGVFLFYSRAGQDPLQIRSLSPAQNNDFYPELMTRSYAAFFQGTYALTDRTGATVGLRYTTDEKDYEAQRVAVAPHPLAGTVLQDTALLSDPQETSYDELTWRFAIEHQFQPTVFGYASANRGFKSGGHNAGSIGGPPLEPEILDAYALGLKTELFDRSLRLNVELFHYDYKDIQLQIIETGVNQQINASSAEVNGADIDVTWAAPLATQSLELTASISLLDGSYGRFLSAPGFIPFPGTPIPPNFFNCGPPPAASGNRQCTVNATGAQMIKAPDWTSTVSLAYRRPLTQLGELGFNLSWYHNDGFVWEPDQRIKQPSYDLLNAQVSVSSSSGQWVSRLFGRNLTNEEYYVQVASSPLVDAGTAGAPRTYGVAIDYHF